MGDGRWEMEDGNGKFEVGIRKMKTGRWKQGDGRREFEGVFKVLFFNEERK
jgi:hypothetical protein